MSGFDYNHFSSDFSRRTQSNLELVFKLAKYQREISSTDIEPTTLLKDDKPETADQKRAMRRTKQLLESISSSEFKAFEITQLLLSIYGMLLIPFEKYSKDPNVTKTNIKNALKRTSEYSQLKEKLDKLESCHKYRNTYRDNKYDSVYSFIHHLRNSISHEGVHFLPLASGQVESIQNIIFYDYDAMHYDSFNKSPQKFCVDIDKDLLRDIISWICKMYMQVSKEYDMGDQARYNEAINICRAFLEEA